MRKTALLWLVLASLCGGILFQTSQRVNDGRTRLANINAALKKEDESLRVLQAEWSYLNQPDRLEKLSKKYLGLAPLKGKQFGKVSELAVKPAPVPVTEAPVVAVVPVPEKPAIVLKPLTAAEISPVFAPQPAKPRPPSAKTSAWAEQPRTAGGARAPAPAAPHAPQGRDFGDVIKSLGVQ